MSSHFMVVSFLRDTVLAEHLADFSSVYCSHSIGMAGWCMTAHKYFYNIHGVFYFILNKLYTILSSSLNKI